MSTTKSTKTPISYSGKRMPVQQRTRKSSNKTNIKVGAIVGVSIDIDFHKIGKTFMNKAKEIYDSIF